MVNTNSPRLVTRTPEIPDILAQGLREECPKHCRTTVGRWWIYCQIHIKSYKHEHDYWPWLGMISANFWMYRTGNNLRRVGIQVVAYYYYNALCLRGPWSSGHGESLSPDLNGSHSEAPEALCHVHFPLAPATGGQKFLGCH